MLIKKFYIFFYVGYGVFTTNRILKGAFICEYDGELLSHSKERSEEILMRIKMVTLCISLITMAQSFGK